MQKVLVPYDGSDSSIRALRFVLDQPGSSRPTELHLLNVQEHPIVYTEFITSSMLDAIREAQMQLARKLLDDAVALVAPSGVPHREHIVVGFPDQAIADQAALLGCDQIVMGTRGLGTIKGLVLGSVAQKVVHLARVPVTLVK